ncbi:HD domain-containing protein [Streptomyces sp. NPDC004290]
MTLVPDSRLATAATELVRDTTGDLIYHHSRRVYLFGALRGRAQGLSFDPELLYVGAMFHDLGLGEKHRTSGRRFEVDGAEEAAAFLRAQGADEDAVRRVWTAIALHTTPGVPAYMEPEVALVTAGVEYDVLGIGYDDPAAVTPEDRAAIVAAHPRPDFKRQILAAFAEGIAPRPDTTFGNVKADVLRHFVPGFVPGDFVTTIRESSWPE